MPTAESDDVADKGDAAPSEVRRSSLDVEAGTKTGGSTGASDSYSPFEADTVPTQGPAPGDPVKSARGQGLGKSGSSEARDDANGAMELGREGSVALPQRLEVDAMQDVKRSKAARTLRRLDSTTHNSAHHHMREAAICFLLQFKMQPVSKADLQASKALQLCQLHGGKCGG